MNRIVVNLFERKIDDIPPLVGISSALAILKLVRE